MDDNLQRKFKFQILHSNEGFRVDMVNRGIPESEIIVKMEVFLQILKESPATPGNLDPFRRSGCLSAGPSEGMGVDAVLSAGYQCPD